jgi:hypothetical protein
MGPAPTIEISQVTEKNLICALKQVRGHLKATSMLWMHVLGAPVLRGLILADWSSASAQGFKRFCARNGFECVLLRIDKQCQRWTNRRGGYILPVEQVGRVLRELRREQTLAITLEPVSPYSDRYSFAAVVEPERSSMTIEVVGPGFDASDLLRSDTQPHQRFEVHIALRDPSSSGNFDCRCAYVVGAEDYQATVEQRLIKIGARLRNPAFPRSVKQSSQRDEDRLRSDAIAYLTRSKQTLLLRHQDAFVPIPHKHVSRFVSGVTRVLAGLANYGIHLGPTSFSASLIGAGRLVFWDFFPARTREADALYLGN